jgi:hypothetical protein
VPERYDSSGSKAAIDWVERGPVRASVRVQHKWPMLKFETRVNLCAGWPYVEVVSRVLSEVPPLPDKLTEGGRFPVEITNGYWLSFTPGFAATTVVRDFPLGIEATREAAFHALTFVDLAGEEQGLLLLHPGTQYFKRTAEGRLSNLVMREWESYFTGDYGWPRYSEYRHVLMPHGAGLDNATRLRASTEFSQGLRAHLGAGGGGALPVRKSFVAVSPANVQLLAFRGKREGGCELRVLEVEGQKAGASIELGFPVSGAVATDLLGNKISEVGHAGSRIQVGMDPWKVRTIAMK